MDNLEITLKLPLAQVNIALKGLGELPLKEAKDAWVAMFTQTQAQVNEAGKPKAEEPA